MDVFYEQASTCCSRRRRYRAFDLAAEPAALRERYGWHHFGQSLLLARRLVEARRAAGHRLLEHPEHSTIDGSWDTHKDSTGG